MPMTPRTATAPGWFTASSKDSRISPWNLKQVIYTAGNDIEQTPFNRNVPMLVVDLRGTLWKLKKKKDFATLHLN